HGFDPGSGKVWSSHSTENMACLVAGKVGGLKAGIHLPAAGSHPAQALLTAMRAAGFSGTSLGEVSGEIPGLRASAPFMPRVVGRSDPRSSTASSASCGERLQLLIAELRKGTEEAHHIPAQLLRQRSLEGRHPCEPDAPGDQEEELTVGAPLRFGLPEVWHR